MSKAQRAKAWIDQTGDEDCVVWILVERDHGDRVYVHNTGRPYVPLAAYRDAAASFARQWGIDDAYVPRRMWRGMLRATCPMRVVLAARSTP